MRGFQDRQRSIDKRPLTLATSTLAVKPTVTGLLDGVTADNFTSTPHRTPLIYIPFSLTTSKTSSHQQDNLHPVLPLTLLSRYQPPLPCFIQRLQLSRANPRNTILLIIP